MEKLLVAYDGSEQSADVIKTVADERDFNPIVMGRRDRRLVHRVILRSVSDEVLRRTTWPALVVR